MQHLQQTRGWRAARPTQHNSPIALLSEALPVRRECIGRTIGAGSSLRQAVPRPRFRRFRVRLFAWEGAMGKFSRSWELVKQSFAILRSDKQLMLFPVLSAIACFIVTTIIATGGAFLMMPARASALAAGEHFHPNQSPMFMLGMFALYVVRSEEHTSELQSRLHIVCRLLLEKKKTIIHAPSG